MTARVDSIHEENNSHGNAEEVQLENLDNVQAERELVQYQSVNDGLHSAAMGVDNLDGCSSLVSHIKVNNRSLSLIHPFTQLPSFSFHCLSSLSVNLDMLVPSYFADLHSIFKLASILVDDCLDQQVSSNPKVIGLPRPLTPLVPYSDSEDDDDVQLIPRLPPSSTPHKRCSLKLKEPLDDSFLTRSKRRQPVHDGFRDDASAKEALDYPKIYEARTQDGVPPAPSLGLDVIQGIRVGFLKVRPEDVSAAALFDLDDDDDATSAM
ncbi:hypothetical protein HU200_063911 [Digitaria exilis]|uniref:Uncharacterized protein n=1 Tax=Digitaria exilis TaxID=1010633 RepID=A0A835AAL0_9POAL|nr:hypothetical protein HU200_063911 [Digitaria exilis]